MNVRALALPIAAAISLTFVGAASAPAMARDANTCQTAPAAIRSAATTAQADAQRKALSLVSLGEKLCASDAQFEASKKFAAAAKALGTDMAALATPAPTAQ